MKRIVSISAFSITSWVILLLIYNFKSPGQEFSILIPTFMTTVALANVYLFNYWIIPKYYFTREYFRFTFFSLAAFILSSYIQLLFIFGLFIHIRFELQTVTPRLFDVLVIILNTWFVALAGISLKQTSDVASKSKKQEELLKEKLEMELKMLKAQINPHFLFNTLNSIYILAKKKSETTPEMVLKLSSILDFLLHYSGTSEIDIMKEIEFITDYIALEKIRYGSKLKIELFIDVSEPHLKTEPMIMIPLVENAFKHGVKPERKKAWVSIKISDQDGIEVEVKNSIPLSEQNKEMSGLGLKNLKNRLENRYPGAYTLSLKKNEDSFTAKLKIKRKVDH